ncbi:unnamed protein product [Hyaloperonospora brassicae]|uniref:Uncharacterized protein n=1 Tax=Hyaloperonospora brassicae TaxID=162125 RepID=A0AAV0TAN2_HYABA|nr:unnamed protein product [Hyaloperonospora brassicae]
MGNFLVSAVCSAHSHSEAAYALVRTQVRVLQRRPPPLLLLQRQCTAHQTAVGRALSSALALFAATACDRAAAAADHAKTQLVAFLVRAAQKLLTRAKPLPQLAALSPSDEDDVLDAFHAVFDATSKRPKQTVRALQHSAELAATRRAAEAELSKRWVATGGRDGHDGDTSGSGAVIESSDLDDGFVVLPDVGEGRGVYAGLEDTGVAQCDDDSPTEGERLLQLASSISTASLHVDQFLLTGQHEKADAIAKDVDAFAAMASEREKQSVVRVLVAYCAYSKDWNYSSDMVLTASEYLRVWQGDEDRALKSLAVLCNDVPRLCAAFE